MKLPCLPDAWFAVLKGVLPRMLPRRAPLQAQGALGARTDDACVSFLFLPWHAVMARGSVS
jgi:hypothetical protein